MQQVRAAINGHHQHQHQQQLLTLSPRSETHETHADAPTVPDAACVPRKSIVPTSFPFSQHPSAGDDGGGIGLGWASCAGVVFLLFCVCSNQGGGDRGRVRQLFFQIRIVFLVALVALARWVRCVQLFASIIPM